MIERESREKSRSRGLYAQVAFHRAWTFCLVCLVVVGCGAQPTYEFDELDLTPAQDELAEVSLGHYVIPIPYRPSLPAEGSGLPRNRIELSFDLHVLVTRGYESQVADMWQRHEGKIRDAVIRVCRNASPDDLHEPELATLKSHLTDVVQAQLGAKSIRRLVVTEIKTQQI